MRDGDTKAHPGAHGLLAVAQSSHGLLAMRGFKPAAGHETIYDLPDGLPPVGGHHRGNDLILGKQAG